MASHAILTNFFLERGRKNHPQYLSGLSRALFPTTFLETTVYRAIKWKDLHESDATALLNDVKKIFWRTISKIRHFLMFHWMNHSPGSLMKNQYTCKLWQWAAYKTYLFAGDKSSPQPNLDLASNTLLTVWQNFSRSVHILEIPLFFRLICIVCGPESPGVEFKVRVMSR